MVLKIPSDDLQSVSTGSRRDLVKRLFLVQGYHASRLVPSEDALRRLRFLLRLQCAYDPSGLLLGQIVC